MAERNDEKRCFICGVPCDGEAILAPVTEVLAGNPGVWLCDGCEVSSEGLFGALGLGPIADVPQT